MYVSWFIMESGSSNGRGLVARHVGGTTRSRGGMVNASQENPDINRGFQ